MLLHTAVVTHKYLKDSQLPVILARKTAKLGVTGHNKFLENFFINWTFVNKILTHSVIKPSQAT
jgi:hypothetical protein